MGRLPHTGQTKTPCTFGPPDSTRRPGPGPPYLRSHLFLPVSHTLFRLLSGVSFLGFRGPPLRPQCLWLPPTSKSRLTTAGTSSKESLRVTPFRPFPNRRSPVGIRSTVSTEAVSYSRLWSATDSCLDETRPSHTPRPHSPVPHSPSPLRPVVLPRRHCPRVGLSPASTP